jgi:hypothetical protein
MTESHLSASSRYRDRQIATVLHRYVGGYVGPVAAGTDAPLRNRLVPCHPTGGQTDPSDRIHLHDIRRSTPGVSRALADLYRTVWWDAHFHRPSRRAARKGGEEFSHGVTEHRAVRRLVGVERCQDRLQHGGLIVRRGHVGTIRPWVSPQPPAPGSRRYPQTRHSGRRCTCHGLVAALRRPRAG